MSTEPRPKKLLEQVDDAIRLMHYSPRTGETYAHWIKRFIFFHDKRHPKDMGAAEVQAFLTYLAINENVAASTQNQALSALLFLYRRVLHQRRPPLVHQREHRAESGAPSRAGRRHRQTGRAAHAPPLLRPPARSRL